MHNRRAFTLVEILIVLVIMGILTAMVASKFSGLVGDTKVRLTKVQMQDIKRATLGFYEDVGFVPDNVSLLIYPFEKCDVNAINFDDSDTSKACKNMISFLDWHYSHGWDKLRRLDVSVGDIGKGMARESKLINRLQEYFNSPENGWRGGYISGNAHLSAKNIVTLGSNSAGELSENNRYYLSDRDVKIYYADSDYDISTHLSIAAADIAGKADSLLYPIKAHDFNGSLSTESPPKNTMDALYENGKYRDNLEEEITILDPWGTPYEIQIPQIAVSNRMKFARIVSFGKDRRRDTDISLLDIDYDEKGYDDIVLYLFDTNQTGNIN